MPIPHARIRALTHLLTAALLTTTLFTPLTTAQDKPAEDPPAEPQAAADRPAQQAMRTLVNELALTVRDNKDAAPRPIQLHPQPLVSYGDETRFIKDSTLWVWLDGERPALFQKLEVNDWNAGYPLWTWCLASASPGIIEGRWPNVPGDQKTTASVPVKAIPDATVNDNAARWPFEARSLNRRFTAETGPEKGRGDFPEVLRVVARPIFEFKAMDQGVPYGAVFSHAGGTNPTVLMVIQIETQPDGSRRWTYTPMHMTATKVTLKLDGKEVWTDPAQRSGQVTTWGYFFTRRSAAIK